MKKNAYIILTFFISLCICSVALSIVSDYFKNPDSGKKSFVFTLAALLLFTSLAMTFAACSKENDKSDKKDLIPLLAIAILAHQNLDSKDESVQTNLQAVQPTTTSEQSNQKEF